MTDGRVPYNATAAGDYISTQLDSSCQGKRYGTEKAGGTARPSRTKSHLLGHFPLASQEGRRVGPALYTIGLIGPSFHLELVLARFRAGYAKSVHGITGDGSILDTKLTNFEIPSERQKAMAKSKKMYRERN
jgi:hypothetical protein